MEIILLDLCGNDFSFRRAVEKAPPTFGCQVYQTISLRKSATKIFMAGPPNPLS